MVDADTAGIQTGRVGQHVGGMQMKRLLEKSEVILNLRRWGILSVVFFAFSFSVALVKEKKSFSAWLEYEYFIHSD